MIQIIENIAFVGPGNTGPEGPLSKPACCRVALVSAILFFASAAKAELKFIPYAESQVQYDSNVYRVSNSDILDVDGRERTDVVFSNVLGLDAEYLWAQQKVRAKVEGRRFDYVNSPALNRYEYLFGSGLDWILFGRLNGTLDFTQERRLAGFADRNTSQLNFERNRLGNATVNFLLTNDWRMEGGYALHELLTPVIGASALKLTENTGSAALKYVGISRLAIGIGGNYVKGNYSGVANATRFTQYAGSGIVTYEASDISKFNFAAGYSKRESSGGANAPGGGNAGGFTGEIGYDRELTGKTSASLKAYRRIESFDAGDNTIIETGGSAAINWQATLKLGAGISYDYTYGAFQGAGLPGSLDLNRRDRLQTASLKIRYEALRWLQVQTYGTYQARTSNVETSSYNDALLGLELIARFE